MSVTWIVVPFSVVACATPGVPSQLVALRGSLTPRLVQGRDYLHQVFASEIKADATLIVFIDGDGSPWVDGGLRIAADPTPRHPLALELARDTSRSTLYTVMYLGRPCNFEARADKACTPDLWTSARYSARVVNSMAAALEHLIAGSGTQRVVLLGYSGGGTLAVLMAQQLPEVVAVVTIAANLDIEAWTTAHGYLPLTDSLNPATLAPLPPRVAQIHLVGERDTNAPELLSRRFLRNVPVNNVWRYADFDHVCCWVEQWPGIFRRIESAIDPVSR